MAENNEWKLSGDKRRIFAGSRIVAGVNIMQWTDAEFERNALLLVSAPRLLEALEDIIEQAEKTRLPLGADLADSIRVFGRQAVAVAKEGGK